MRTFIAIIASLLVASPALAQRKDCGELNSEIETKIKNNGVTTFTLTVVDKDSAEDGKVVGTCDSGTKKIVYKRGAAAPSAAAPSAAAPSAAPAGEAKK